MGTDTTTAPFNPQRTVHATVVSEQSAPPQQLQWRWVYALLPLLLGLLLVARRQPLPRGGHLVLQCAIVLLVYGLLTRWLYTNRVALRPAKPTPPAPTVYVIYVPTCDGSTVDGLTKRAAALDMQHARRVIQNARQASLPLYVGSAVDEVRNG